MAAPRGNHPPRWIAVVGAITSIVVAATAIISTILMRRPAQEVCVLRICSAARPVEGLWIRNALSGRFTTDPVRANGDVLLGEEFLETATPIEIYSSDRKTLLGTTKIQFSTKVRYQTYELNSGSPEPR
jgi:hypothetical protein